jgi:hypothetical protein
MFSDSMIFLLRERKHSVGGKQHYPTENLLFVAGRKREALVVSRELELEKKKDKWEAKKESWEAKKEDWEKDRLALTAENTRLATEISFIRSQQEK